MSDCPDASPALGAGVASGAAGPPRPRQVSALHDHGQADRLADLAARALTVEVELHPKPGLVDPRSRGAHVDMDLSTFHASIAALRPWFPVFHETGRAAHQRGPAEFLSLLRAPGLACERAMFAATGGVNTHKGAVFAFALLLGCAGRLSAAGLPVTTSHLSHLCARMATPLLRQELPAVGVPGTYGELAYVRHGLTGARGEAASGFASVVRGSLPAYRETLRACGDERLALLQALLVLLRRTEDTTLVKDGSLSGLRFVQDEAGALLDDGGVLAPDALARLHALDRELTRLRLSPGGCADLLAVTYFFAHLDG